MSATALLHDFDAGDPPREAGPKNWLAAAAMVMLMHSGIWFIYTHWQSVQIKPQPLPSVQISLVSAPAPQDTTPPPQPQRAPAAPKQPITPAPTPARPQVEASTTAEAPTTTADSNEVAQPAVREETTPPLYQAAYLNNPPPNYPLAARRRGIEGTVLVRALINEEGNCHEAVLSKSSGHEMLDQAALAAVRSWRFVPAKHGAQTVSAWVLVPITFRLSKQNEQT